jgi:MoxR-like ATPase
MFQPQVLGKLVSTHIDTFKSLHKVEIELQERFYKMDNAIQALILAVASGEPLLLIGPPGTAKSRLIRTFCGLLGLLELQNLSKRKPEYFEYLLTPFTEPGELFGYYDIAKIKEKLVRESSMMMQEAQVVYLDEVFNASSAILNTLLAFMNERYFHDRGQRIEVPLQCLFAATNHVPDAPELHAVFDRFLLRCHVSNIEPATPQNIGELLSSGWKDTYALPAAGSNGAATTAGAKGKGKPPAFPIQRDLLEGLKKLRTHIKELTRDGELIPQLGDPFYGVLSKKIEFARATQLSDVSNRRLVKMIHVMLIHRLYEVVALDNVSPGATIKMGDAQINLFDKFFLDRDNEFLRRKLRRDSRVPTP